MHSVREDYCEGNALHVQQHKSSGNKVKTAPILCQLSKPSKSIGKRGNRGMCFSVEAHTQSSNPCTQQYVEGYFNNCQEPTSRFVGTWWRACIKTKSSTYQRRSSGHRESNAAKRMNSGEKMCPSFMRLRFSSLELCVIEVNWVPELNWNLSREVLKKKRSGSVTLTIHTPTLNAIQNKQKKTVSSR